MWIMTDSPACSLTVMYFSDCIVQLANVIASCRIPSDGTCGRKWVKRKQLLPSIAPFLKNTAKPAHGTHDATCFAFQLSLLCKERGFGVSCAVQGQPLLVETPSRPPQIPCTFAPCCPGGEDEGFGRAKTHASSKPQTQKPPHTSGKKSGTCVMHAAEFPEHRQCYDARRAIAASMQSYCTGLRGVSAAASPPTFPTTQAVREWCDRVVSFPAGGQGRCTARVQQPATPWLQASTSTSDGTHLAVTCPGPTPDDARQQGGGQLKTRIFGRHPLPLAGTPRLQHS